MVVTSFTQEFETPIEAERMFKALIVDSHNLIPTLMPQFIKSIECVEGDGSAGSIKQTNFPEGGQLKYLKYKINVFDAEALHCKYTLIDGDVLDDKLEFVVYDVKFEACNNGGCIWKMTSEYHTKGDIQLREDQIKEGKDKVIEMYKVIQDYLLQNPNVYA